MQHCSLPQADLSAVLYIRKNENEIIDTKWPEILFYDLHYDEVQGDFRATTSRTTLHLTPAVVKINKFWEGDPLKVILIIRAAAWESQQNDPEKTQIRMCIHQVWSEWQETPFCSNFRMITAIIILVF